MIRQLNLVINYVHLVAAHGHTIFCFEQTTFVAKCNESKGLQGICYVSLTTEHVLVQIYQLMSVYYYGYAS